MTDQYARLRDLRPPPMYAKDRGYDRTDPFCSSHVTDMIVERMRLYDAGDPVSVKYIEDARRVIDKGTPKERRMTTEEIVAELRLVKPRPEHAKDQVTKRLYLQKNYPEWFKANYPWF